MATIEIIIVLACGIIAACAAFYLGSKENRCRCPKCFPGETETGELCPHCKTEMLWRVANRLDK